MEVINDEYISKLEAVRILQTACTEGRIQAKDGCVSVLDDINALPSADVQPVKQENMNRCYFCGNETNSDLTVIICDKTLLQSELFRARMCSECFEVLKASITLLKHIRR